jgi:hypothetical protein
MNSKNKIENTSKPYSVALKGLNHAINQNKKSQACVPLRRLVGEESLSILHSGEVVAISDWT